MFTLMAVTIDHQSDVTTAAPPRSKERNGRTTHAHKERTFMDIFTCRRCKKNRHQRHQYTDNEGSSSTEEEYHSSSSTGEAKHSIEQTICRRAAAREEDSLKRPLQCKQSLGRRQVHGRSRHIDEGSPSAGFLDGWRSLPNLRSPSLTVRAMTLKLRSLKGSGDEKGTGKAKTKKRARFNETVDVILQDDNGEPLCAQFVPIKYDDDDDAGGAPSDCCRLKGNGMATAANGGAPGGGDGDKANGPGAPTEGAPRRANRRPNPYSIRMDFMDIKRNDEGQRYLKCVIFIGEEFDRRRITVRTAMGGSRLVLIAYKTEPLGDGTYYWQQFVEKFRLPHAIDPHQVNAVMHSAGDLVIEAPLFEFETDS